MAARAKNLLKTSYTGISYKDLVTGNIQGKAVQGNIGTRAIRCQLLKSIPGLVLEVDMVMHTLDILFSVLVSVTEEDLPVHTRAKMTRS